MAELRKHLWEQQFDHYLHSFFGISINDVGDDAYKLYGDMAPSAAALFYGDKYELTRV